MCKYFEVTTKCGHVGKYKCIWINFAIMAESAKDAVKKVKEFGRIKHHHKNCIKQVKEINFYYFMKLKAQNDADPYLHCKSVQEQRTIVGFEKRLELDEYNIARFSKKKNKEKFFRI